MSKFGGDEEPEARPLSGSELLRKLYQSNPLDPGLPADRAAWTNEEEEPWT
jgi:hypothetical protein